MNQRTSNSLRNVVYGMGAKIIAMILPFVVRTLIIRKLGIEYGGLNSFFSAILNFLSLTELGFGSTLVFTMYKPVAENNTEKICSLLNLYKKIYHVVGVVILVIGGIIIPFLPKLVNGDVPSDINLYILYLIFLCNTSLSYFLFAYRSSLFVAFQRTDVQSKVMLVSYTIMSIAQITSILLLKNYYLYALSNIIYTVLQNILIYLLSKRYFPDIICKGIILKSEVHELFYKTIALAGHKIGGTVVSSLDSIVISSILGLTAVGVYGNYYTIMSALMAFIGVYNNATLPSIGNYLIREKEEDQYILFINLNFMHIWVVGWFSLCLFILLPNFIELWVGKELLFSFTETILVCVYFYSWQFRVLSCNFKDAGGLWTEDALKPYIASITNIVLNIILVKKIGISGALISTILCMFFIFYPWETHVLFGKLFKRSSKSYLLKEMKWALIWLVLAIAMYFICAQIHVNNLVISLLIKGALCLVLPNVVFLLLNCKTDEFKFIIRKIRGLLDGRTNKKVITTS